MIIILIIIITQKAHPNLPLLTTSEFAFSEICE